MKLAKLTGYQDEVSAYSSSMFGTVREGRELRREQQGNCHQRGPEQSHEDEDVKPAGEIAERVLLDDDVADRHDREDHAEQHRRLRAAEGDDHRRDGEADRGEESTAIERHLEEQERQGKQAEGGDDADVVHAARDHAAQHEDAGRQHRAAAGHPSLWPWTARARPPTRRWA